MKDNYILALRRSKKGNKNKCTANLMPCCIDHNGPVSISRRYWNPVEKDGLHVAYFRGKKLHGRRLDLPKGYRGAVMSKTDQVVTPDNVEGKKVDPFITEEDMQDSMKDEIQEDEAPVVRILEEKYQFENIMVWGHETLSDTITDSTVRGMLEWKDFSKLIHSHDNDDDDFDNATTTTSGPS